MASSESPTPLACPYCQKPGGKKKSGRRPNDHKTLSVMTRTYVCAECEKEFATEERMAAPLANVTVNTRPFNRGQLKASIARIAPKRLTDVEADEVSKQAMYNIEAHVQADPLPRRDKHQNVVIDSAAVADRTLEAFLQVARRHRETGTRRDSLLAAHVQYALATRGPKWEDAAGFVQWYRGQPEYVSWAPRLPTPQGPRGTRSWVVPSTVPPTTIKTVIKNSFVNPGDQFNPGHMKETRHRDREAFDRDKLERSIEASLRGRRRSGEAALLERYVLWALAGQVHVRSSQISTLVSVVLRSMDDIAYLRWVMIGKELDARTVIDEAFGLIQHPSPSLEFTNDDARLLWVGPSS